MFGIDIILKFVITFVLSFVFGFDRQRSHKPVGFGTFIFVAVGACVLGMTAIGLSPENPLPLLSAIVTGIGFLGAGAMIRNGDKVMGATTAASIWLFAIFGLTVGVGEFLVAFLIYAGLWVVVLFDRQLEERGIGSYQRRLTIITHQIMNEKDIRKILLSVTKKHRLISVEVSKKESKLAIVYLIEGTRTNLNKIPKRLFEEEWFDSCKIE